MIIRSYSKVQVSRILPEVDGGKTVVMLLLWEVVGGVSTSRCRFNPDCTICGEFVLVEPGGAVVP